MSAKITIREIDGSEYQLKKRVAEAVLRAGYCRKVQRGLFEMLSVTLPTALKVITRYHDSGELNPEGPPECSFATYPVRDMRSSPKPFGYSQDWAHF